MKSIIKEIGRTNRNITKLEQACRTNFYTQEYILRQRVCFSSIVIGFLEEIPWILYDICTLRIHEESFPHILTRSYRRHYTSRLHEHRCATSRRHFLKPRDHTLFVSRFDTIPTYVKTKLRNETVHTLYILLCTCFEHIFVEVWTSLIKVHTISYLSLASFNLSLLSHVIFELLNN